MATKETNMEESRIRDEEHLIGTLATYLRLKLSSKRDKGSWKNDSPLGLFLRLLEEVHELEIAVGEGQDPDSVWREAADVSAYAAMIASVYANRVKSMTEPLIGELEELRSAVLTLRQQCGYYEYEYEPHWKKWNKALRQLDSQLSKGESKMTAIKKLESYSCAPAYDLVMAWRKTSECLPTTENGRQINVLIWSPEWATWLKGMFTFRKDEPPEWALYDQQHDRYEEMDQLHPEYWCTPILPNAADDMC